MKILFLLILLTFSACATPSGKGSKEDGHKSSSLSTGEHISAGREFSTPFGSLKIGMSQGEVKALLGNPHYTTTEGNREVWWYKFSGEGRVVIYFVNGQVIEVEEGHGQATPSR